MHFPQQCSGPNGQGPLRGPGVHFTLHCACTQTHPEMNQRVDGFVAHFYYRFDFIDIVLRKYFEQTPVDSTRTNWRHISSLIQSDPIQ